MDQEKIYDETVEDVKSGVSVPDIDPEAEKRLLRKLDIHVVPILMFLFLLAFLDRINIGNARIQGLEKDLGMKGHDYNIALFIFFIPYILFEVPSNLFLKKVSPSWWLSGIMFSWGMFEPTYMKGLELTSIILGVVTTCQGVVKSFGGLVACRFLLGLFEAGLMPGWIAFDPLMEHLLMF